MSPIGTMFTISFVNNDPLKQKLEWTNVHMCTKLHTQLCVI